MQGCDPPPPHPPCPPPPPPLEGGTITWPMNNKKSTGNHRGQRRRRKIFVGYTRIQVTVVWCPSPPPPPTGSGGNRHLVTVPPGVGGGGASSLGWGGGHGGGGGTQNLCLYNCCSVSATLPHTRLCPSVAWVPHDSLCTLMHVLIGQSKIEAKSSKSMQKKSWCLWFVHAWHTWILGSTWLIGSPPSVSLQMPSETLQPPLVALQCHPIVYLNTELPLNGPSYFFYFFFQKPTW